MGLHGGRGNGAARPVVITCQHCGDRAVYEHTEECHRCAEARQKLDEALEGLPYLVALRLTAKANGRLRSEQQQEFARRNPEHYQAGWLKRKFERREFRRAAGAKVSENFTAPFEKPQK